jgi:hypothetical protein
VEEVDLNIKFLQTIPKSLFEHDSQRTHISLSRLLLTHDLLLFSLGVTLSLCFNHPRANTSDAVEDTNQLENTNQLPEEASKWVTPIGEKSSLASVSPTVSSIFEPSSQRHRISADSAAALPCPARADELGALQSSMKATETASRV